MRDQKAEVEGVNLFQIFRNSFAGRYESFFFIFLLLAETYKCLVIDIRICSIKGYLTMPADIPTQ